MNLKQLIEWETVPASIFGLLIFPNGSEKIICLAEEREFKAEPKKGCVADQKICEVLYDDYDFLRNLGNPRLDCSNIGSFVVRPMNRGGVEIYMEYSAAMPMTRRHHLEKGWQKEIDQALKGFGPRIKNRVKLTLNAASL